MAPAVRGPAFEKDEKTLCFHGQFLYEAKILELETVKSEDPNNKRGITKYRVHYKGWKNTWDDWVGEERLRKYTEENREVARNLINDLRRQQKEEEEMKKARKQLSAKKRAGIASDLNSERSSSVAINEKFRGTKRGRDWEIEKEESFMTKPMVRIPVPDQLKSLLVDDWEYVTKNNHLVPLPHPRPVTKILEDYKIEELPKRQPGGNDADILEEILYGLRDFFNTCLGKVLLYRQERPQWLQVYERMQMTPGASKKDRNYKDFSLRDGDPELFAGKTSADIYGAEHLSRLCVHIPQLIAQTNMDVPSVNRLREELVKLTTWLSKHCNTYFVSEYLDPGAEYVAKVKIGKGIHNDEEADLLHFGTEEEQDRILYLAANRIGYVVHDRRWDDERQHGLGGPNERRDAFGSTYPESALDEASSSDSSSTDDGSTDDLSKDDASAVPASAIGRLAVKNSGLCQVLRKASGRRLKAKDGEDGCDRPIKKEY